MPMSLLLDTHVFLWFIMGDARIPIAVRAVIADPNNSVYVSVATVWECIIKFSLGKMQLAGPPDIYLPQQRLLHGFSSLWIDDESMNHLTTLPRLHRDPFDQIIVAQALQHSLHLVTFDRAVRQYPVMLYPK